MIFKKINTSSSFFEFIMKKLKISDIMPINEG